MVLSKEVRIGLLVSVSLVILFIGFYFLKGANLFSKDKEYYCFYNNVEGLENSANVQVKGLNVGHVTGMKLVDGKGVMVQVSVNSSVEVPAGTVASLAAFDLLGTKMIRLDLGAGPGTVTPGTELPSAKEGGIIDNLSASLTPRLQELKVTIASFDSALNSVNVIVGAQNQAKIAAAIESVKATADNLAHLTGTLNSEGGEITSIVHNANSITGNLAKENDTIQHILANASNITRQLANAPIQKTMTDLQATTSELQGIMDKINSGQGSLGLLINNKDVYNNLNNSLGSLHSLMDDLKAHPSRYINVTIFGKKKN